MSAEYVIRCYSFYFSNWRGSTLLSQNRNVLISYIKFFSSLLQYLLKVFNIFLIHKQTSETAIGRLIETTRTWFLRLAAEVNMTWLPGFNVPSRGISWQKTRCSHRRGGLQCHAPYIHVFVRGSNVIFATWHPSRCVGALRNRVVKKLLYVFKLGACYRSTCN